MTEPFTYSKILKKIKNPKDKYIYELDKEYKIIKYIIGDPDDYMSNLVCHSISCRCHGNNRIYTVGTLLTHT